MNTAIVTGCSKGIGLAICQLLLQNNIQVAGWSRGECAIDHPNFLHIHCDVTDPTSVATALVKSLDRFTTIEYLINNAGVGYFKLFEDIAWDEWKTMFDINVHGIFNCTKQILPHLKQNKQGHIINISSIAGTMAIPEATGYCATKFAVRGFTQSLFKEVRPHGIKVSCIYPGSVQTDFFAHYPSVTVNDNMLHANDIAEGVLYLLHSSIKACPVELEIRPMQIKM